MGLATVVPAVGYGRCRASRPAGGGRHVGFLHLLELVVVFVGILPLLLVSLPKRRGGWPRCHGVEIAILCAGSRHVAILRVGVPWRPRCSLGSSCTQRLLS